MGPVTCSLKSRIILIDAEAIKKAFSIIPSVVGKKIGELLCLNLRSDSITRKNKALTLLYVSENKFWHGYKVCSGSQCTPHVNLDFMKGLINKQEAFPHAWRGAAHEIEKHLTPLELLTLCKTSLARPPHKLRSNAPRIKIRIITCCIPTLCHRSPVRNK